MPRPRLSPEGGHTLCASLHSRNALQTSTFHKSHFIRKFTGKMLRPRLSPERGHTLCASLRSRYALQHFTRATLYRNLQEKCRAPEWAPWSNTGLYSYRKNPSVWTHCLGKNGKAKSCNQASADLLLLAPLPPLLPLLGPLGGAGPFEAPLLGDFSGKLAGLGDSAGLGNSDLRGSGLGENALEAEASLGLGDCDKSEPGSEGFAVFAFSKSSCVLSDKGRGWLSRPLSGRRVCIGSTGPSPWVEPCPPGAFSLSVLPTPEKPWLTKLRKKPSSSLYKAAETILSESQRVCFASALQSNKHIIIGTAHGSYVVFESTGTVDMHHMRYVSELWW